MSKMKTNQSGIQSVASSRATTVAGEIQSPALRRRFARLALAGACSLGLAGVTARAQSSDTWSGASLTSSNWSDSANWNTLPASGDYLFFAGTAGLINTNDFTGYSFAGLTFNSGAGAFSLYGNSLTLAGGLTNSSSSLATLNLPIVLGAGETVNSASGALSLNGVISDGGSGYSLTLAGSAPLYLLGANTFGGGLLLNGTGTVIITNDAALGATGSNITFAAGGTIAATNFGAATGNTVTLGATRTITVNSGVTAGFSTPDTNNLYVSSFITGAGGVQKRSSSFALGTVRFNNDTDNYTSDFSVGYGNSEFTSVGNQGSASSLGAGATASGGLITLANASSSGTLRYVGTANSSTLRPLAWAGTTATFTLDVTNTGTIAWLNPTNLLVAGPTGSGAKYLSLNGSNTGTNTLAEALMDSTNGASGLAKNGAGQWVLTGTNGYSGFTAINGGTLTIGGPGVLGGGNYAGLTTNNATLAYAGTVSQTNSGVISGTGALVVGGTGTLTLAGNNTYTGSTTVSNGTVNVTGNEINGSWLMPNNNFAATVNFQSAAHVTVNSNAAVQVGSNPANGSASELLNVAGTVTNYGTLQVARAGYLNINNGGTWLQTSNMMISPPAASGFSAFMNVTSGAAFTYAGSNPIILSGSTNNSGQGFLTVGGGTFTTSQGFTNQISTNTGYAQLVLTNGGTLALSANVAQLSQGLNTNGVPFMIIGTGGGVINNGGFSTTVTNVIGGPGNLTLQGSGTLTLSAVDTNAGAITISAGTLTLGGAGSLGAGGTYAGLITNNGSLIHNSTAAETYTGIISGTGSLTQQSGGDLTLNAANTYSGGTTLAGATLRVKSSNTALGTGLLTATGSATLATQSGSSAVTLTNTVSLNPGVTLSVDSGYANISLAGAITNTGNFATASTGTTTLLATNTYTGTTTDGASAVLTIGGAGLLGGGSYNGTLAIGNTVNYSSTAAQTLGGVISGAGAGGLNVTAGALTLTATNTYTAPTTVTGGTLALSANGSIATTPAIIIAPTGLLNVSGLTGTFALGSAQALTAGSPATVTAVTNITGNISSGGSVNIAGSGTNGTLTVNGGLTLTGGTLTYDLLTPTTGDDLVTLTGASPTLNLSGTTTVAVNAPVTNGTYTLINGISTVASGSAANLALAAAATNAMRKATASFTVAAPTVTLTIASGATNLFWQGTTSGAWDVNTTANWTNSPGATSDKFFSQDIVTFADTALATVAGTNVTVATTVYPASVTYNNSTKTFSLSGAGGIGGAAVVTKSGTGLVTISNANTYVGGTVITAGTLKLATNNPNGLGNGPLALTGGVLDINSNSLAVTSLSGTAGVITNTYITAANVTRTLTVNLASGTNNYAGLIQKGISTTTNDISLVKNGGGTLTLTGAGTFSGASTVNAGALYMEGTTPNGRVYTLASGAQLFLGYSTSDSFGYGDGVTVNGSGTASTNGLYLRGGKSFQFGGGFTLTGTPTTVQAYGTGNATLSGGDVNDIHLTVAASGSGSILAPNISVSPSSYGWHISVASGTNNANGDLLIGGVIAYNGSGASGGGGNGNGAPYVNNLWKVGTGSLLLTNANTFLPATFLSAGQIILAGGNNRLAAGSGIMIGNGATLQLNGIAQTFTNVMGSSATVGGSVVGGSATLSTLTINNGFADTNAGPVGGSALNQNNLALVKSGAGQLVLAGVLTYTNSTTVTAGSLWVSSLTNQDGVTLTVPDVAGSLAATNLTLGTSVGSTVAITGFASAASAPIVATNLTVNGVTTVTLAGTFTSGQYPLIKFNSGTIGGTGSFTVQQTGLPRGVTAAIVTNVPNSSIDVILTANPLVWVGATNGVNTATWDNGITTNWTLAGTANYFTNNDNVQVDDTATGSTTLNLVANLNPFAVLVTNNAKNFTFSATGTSALTGTMSLTKQGPGLLTITESNAFTGGVTISAGAINLQNAWGFNTNTVTVAAGAELQVQGGLNVTPATALALNSTGTNVTGGLHSLSGTNIFGGTITLGASARINSDSGQLSPTNGITAGVNTLYLGGSGNIAISSGTVSGTGGLVKDGTGTNIWSVDPSITSGGVTVSNGVFQINNGNFGGTFTPLLTVEPGATLLGTATHNTGGGTAIVLNRGTWLQDAEDYKQNLTMIDGLIGPGPVLTSAGADLRVGSSGGAGNWTWYVSNSIAGSVINSKLNTVGSPTTVVNLTLNVTRGAAAVDLTQNGLVYGGGNLLLTGNGITAFTGTTNTYTGWTTVNGGTLIIPNSQTGGGAFTNSDGATLGINIISNNVANLPMSTLVLGTNTGATIQFLGFTGSTNASLNATNLLTAGTVTVLVTNSNPLAYAVGQWPLIKYTGSIGGAGFGAFTLAPLPRGVIAVLVNNTANHSVDLNVTANDGIIWSGAINGTWDTNNTANWTAGGVATTYQQTLTNGPGDGAIFNDAATGTTLVTLNQSVTPRFVTFNNSNLNYSLGGTGSLLTNVSLTGTGTVTNTMATLGNTINIFGGTLEMQAGANPTFVVSAGATLRHGYSNGGGYEPGMTLNGSGASSTNGLYLKLGTTFNCNENGGVSIQTAPATIRTYGSGANAVLQGFDVNADFLTVAAAASGSALVPTITLATTSYGYTFNVTAGTNAAGDLTVNGPITGSGAAQVRGEGQATGLHKFGTGSLVLTGTSTFASGVSINGGIIILAGGTNLLPIATTVDLGNGTASGQLVLNGVSQAVTGLLVNGTGTANAVVGGSTTNGILTVTNAGTDVFAGTLGGSGANQNNLAVTVTGNSTLLLSGANTYTGNTTIAAGTLALTNSGSLVSSNIIVSGTGRFDVSGLTSTFVLGGGQTLTNAAGGTGTVSGNLDASAATVSLDYVASPAFTVTNGTLTLSGSTVFNVNNAGSTLLPGSYELIGTANGGALTGTLPSVTVSGGGIPAGASASLTNTGSQLNLVVTTVPTTNTLVLLTGSNPSTYGSSLTFQATITPAPTDGETVSFLDGVTVIGTGNTVGGVATFSTGTLASGTHSITAVYGGDSIYAASTSGALPQTVNLPSSSLTIGSSENPAGYLDSLTFSATLATNATGTVVFSSTNGAFSTNTLSGGAATSAAIASLPRGTNVITVVYGGDSNYLPGTNTFDQIVTNHPPVTTILVASRTAGFPLEIALTDIATNWTDADGDPVELTAVNLTSTNGASVYPVSMTTNLDGSYVITNTAYLGYVPTADVADQLSYSVSDGQGGTNIGYINIVVVSSVTGTNSITSITGGNPNGLTAYGIPGFTYITERSTNLTDWVEISTNTAATNGVISVSDSFSDLGGSAPSSAFYRLLWQP